MTYKILAALEISQCDCCSSVQLQRNQQEEHCVGCTVEKVWDLKAKQIVKLWEKEKKKNIHS